MPPVFGLAEAFGWENDKLGIDAYAARVRVARDFFDEVEEQNFVRTARRGDAQGPQGNVSLVVRKTLKNQVQAVELRVANFSKLNVPDSVVAAMVMLTIAMTLTPRQPHHLYYCANPTQVGDAMTSLDVERFFSMMRRVWPVPYMWQFMQERARVIHEYTKQQLTRAFSYYTGTARKDIHYSNSGAVPVVPFGTAKLGAPRPSRSRSKQAGRTPPLQLFRPYYSFFHLLLCIVNTLPCADEAAKRERWECDVRVLQEASSLLKGQRQQTVTDKAKETAGALPAAMYATPQPFVSTAVAG
jgi:hypothetical protein